MPRRLDVRCDGFDEAFARFLALRRENAPDLGATVAGILSEVDRRGDAALIEFAARFDSVSLGADELRVGADEIAAGRRACDAEVVDALELAADRIAVFHETQLPKSYSTTDGAQIALGYRWTPISAVGLYVPGGRALYPSSLLMNAIPAKVAGVERLAMVTPAGRDGIHPLLLCAAELAGVDEIYRIGGAQAIAALAFGTESVPAVDKIVGPGNAYVAEAKRQVFGRVGIDLIAGPSEILIVADGRNDPAWIAADLLSQAEHDADAQAILITDDAGFADAVEAAIEEQLESLERAEIARESWSRFGAIIQVDSLAAAPALVDAIAPEHLELAVETPEILLSKVRHAGAIFLGRHSPVAVGDYVAGPNPVLPTSRAARFSGGLSVLDFMKRTTIIGCTAGSLKAVGPAAITMARAEGLTAHARSIAIRLEERDDG